MRSHTRANEQEYYDGLTAPYHPWNTHYQAVESDGTLRITCSQEFSEDCTNEVDVLYCGDAMTN